MRNFLKLLGAVALIFTGTFFVGLIIANYIVMPWLTRAHAVVEVPEVCGKPLDIAREILKSAGLVPVVDTTRYDPTVPKGYVISQKPLPTKRVKKGREVHLIVSAGYEKVVIPFVRGLPAAKAIELLLDKGFRIERIKYVESDLPSNHVVRTSPPENSEVLKGTGITLYLSY